MNVSICPKRISLLFWTPHARGACGRSCAKLYTCQRVLRETQRIGSCKCAEPGRAPGVRIAEAPGSNLRGQRARDPYPPHRAVALVEPRPRVWQRSGKDPGATAVDSRRPERSAPAIAEDRTCGDRLPMQKICPLGTGRWISYQRAQRATGAGRCRTSRRRTCCRRDPGGRACAEPAREALSS